MTPRKPFNKLLRLGRLFVIVKFGTPGDWLWRTVTKDEYVITHYFHLGRVNKPSGPEVWSPWKLFVGPLSVAWAYISRMEGEAAVARVKAARERKEI